MVMPLLPLLSPEQVEVVPLANDFPDFLRRPPNHSEFD
jgi:hypothetical protein